MRRCTWIFVAVIACGAVTGWSGLSRAQPARTEAGAAGGVRGSLRSLRWEMHAAGLTRMQDGSDRATRSVTAALALSAVLPGAGQAYNRDWIKAGVAVVLEAALWTGWATWKQEGEDMREEYRAYAHAHYNPVRYAQWLNEYPGYEGEDIATGAAANQIDFTRPDEWTGQEQRIVRRLFDRIQAAERQAHFAEPPRAAFSHQLPHFGEQQYYELIGKYYQYAPGWDDCTASCSIETPSDRFFAYAGLHGDANTLLRRASRMTAFIVINHGLAVVDAAISAQLHNNAVESELSLRPGIDGGVHPEVELAFRF